MFNSKVITIQSNDKIKEGWLQKESRYRKVWRDRWCVLTSEFFYTFANEKQYIDPTEQIENNILKLQQQKEELKKKKGNPSQIGQITKSINKYKDEYKVFKVL